MNPKIIGSILLMIVTMIAVWVLMSISSLYVLETNLAFPNGHNGFATMAKTTLGMPGNIITWLMTLLLLYSLTAAYITGNSSLLQVMLAHDFHLHPSRYVNVLVFTGVFGCFVYLSTAAVDMANRFLMSVEALLLLATLVMLLPHISFDTLTHAKMRAHPLLAAAPIFLTSFGFQVIIPSITNYIGKQARTLCTTILLATTIPLVIYLFWLACTIGVMPLHGAHSFATAHNAHDSVGVFISSLEALVQNPWVNDFISGFANIAMITSFLGVGLSLFDFLADGCKRTNTPLGRFQTAMLTFTPPLVFTLFYPKAFILALGYASIFVAVLLVIIPALMAYRTRTMVSLTSSFRVPGGTPLIVIVVLTGVAMVVLQVISF
jgi:tyrosine-specific transport protein